MSRMLWRVLACGLLAAALGVVGTGGGGCAATNQGSGPYQSQGEASRNAGASERLTQEAVALLGANPAKAESLLKQALTADLYNGPAHNNLGVLYLTQSPPKLYDAASEFEWARKLMPGHPDPRVNLALTLEKAGRTGDALTTYETALEVYPNHLPAMQGITSLQLRSGNTDERTKRYLSDIAYRSNDPRWREWARKQLIGLDVMDQR